METARLERECTLLPLHVGTTPVDGGRWRLGDTRGGRDPELEARSQDLQQALELMVDGGKCAEMVNKEAGSAAL